MKRYFSLILAIAATVSAQIVPSTGNVRGPTSATDNAVARYDGTTGKLVQNSGVTIDDSGNTTAADVILGTSGPSVKSSLSARAPRQGLVFDGTAGATVANVPAFGTADFTFSGVINSKTIPALTIITEADANGFGLRFESNGLLIAYQRGGLDKVTATTAVTAGKSVAFSYVRSSGVGTFYINGIAAGSDPDGTNYSAGNYVLAPSGNLTGTLSVLIYNRALSASEVVALYEAGAPAGADYNSASNTGIITGQNNTFNGGIGNWTSGGTGTVAAGTNVMNCTAGSTADNLAGYITFVNAGYNPNGYYVRVTADITNNSGTVRIGVGRAVLTQIGSLTGNGTFDATVFLPATTDADSFWICGATSSQTFTVDNFQVFRVGLLLAPDAAQAGNGYVWNDQSGNLAQIVLPSSGVQWNLPSVSGQRIRGTTSTNGNQQLLGASVLLPAECQITHVRARARSGTPTITIGTASGGAQIVASVALSTTWLNCTIALTGGIVSSADDIWVGSNSTDVVEIDIAYQPLKL